MGRLDIVYNALESADQEGKLIAAISYFQNRLKRLKLSPILTELHNSKRISLTSEVNVESIASLDPNNYWNIVRSIDDTIPKLECSHIQVILLVNTLVLKAGNDLAGNMPNSSLVAWCRNNPEKAQKIISEAVQSDPICRSHCIFAIRGLNDPGRTFQLLECEDEAIKSIVIRSLGLLEVDTESYSKKALKSCFEAAVKNNSKDSLIAAIESAFRIWNRGNGARLYYQNKFFDAFESDHIELDPTFLSYFLAHHGKALSARNIKKALLILTRKASNPSATLDNLNHALYARDERWSFRAVVDVYSKQITELENTPKSDQVRNFNQWVWEDSKNTSLLFSSWLLGGNFQLCSFLNDIIESTEKDKNLVEIFRLDLPDSAEDQIFMIRKCIGFLFNREVTAASILLSIVKIGKKDAAHEAYQLLYDPLLLCYGGALKDYLTHQTKAKSKRISNCTKKLLRKHKSYITGLAKADELVEFLPTTQHRRIAQMHERVLNKEIQKKAEEHSILSHIATRQTLLYGKNSFYIYHGKRGETTSNIQPLSEFSYSTEIPRLSIIDPVGFNQQLALFRLESKG